MTYRILMMSSLPLAPPWNGADKNIARFLVNHDNCNQFTVYTTAATEWHSECVQTVYTADSSSMPTIAQKLHAFLYLVHNAAKTDIVHIVTSFAHPSLLSIELLHLWRRMYRGAVIHTFPSLGDAPLKPSQFIADVTVVVSEYARQRLQAIGIERVERIFPPVAQDEFLSKTEPDLIRNQLQLGNQAILYPGHYGDDSGLSTMIAAFAHIVPDFPDTVLVVACRTAVGHNPHIESAKVRAEAYQAGILERVRLLEFVDDMPALMRACKITALVPGRMASKMDLPLVLLESLLVGNPIIVTDVAPMNEVLLGDCGYAVQYKDVNALVKALTELLADADKRQQMGETGRKLVEQYCSPRGIIAQYQTFYQQSMNRYEKNAIANT